MGQYWRLVNIDRKERLRNDGGLKLWEMLVNGCLEQLVDLLQKPKWIPLSAGAQTRSRSDKSTLLTLPQEVMDMIVHELCSDSPESLIYLSLTCAYFFRLLGLEFQKILATDSAPWAGHRLIFVGDYADDLFLEAICTGEELQYFEKCKEMYGNNTLYYMAESIMHASNTYPNARQHQYHRHGYEERATGRPGDLEEHVKERLILDDLSLFNRLADLARRPQLTPDHGAAVLRNLTAKQYVRDKAIAESDYAYSLGEVVAVFATWTNDGSGLERLDAEGLWAGHRFDIATMADVSEDGWTDVSQLAVENLMKSTQREKKNGKRAADYTLVKESATPLRSRLSTTTIGLMTAQTMKDLDWRRAIWIHRSPPDQDSV